MDTETEDSRSATSALNSRAGITLSKRERYYQVIDEKFLAPLRIMRGDWRAVVGLSILGFYLLMGTLGVVLIDPPSYGEAQRNLVMFENLNYIFGSDSQGRGLWATIVHATPPMLMMVLGGALFSTGMAAVVGTFSGFKGGVIDRALMLVTDTMLTIPGLPLVIIIAAIFKPESAFVIGVLLSINGWSGLARSLRSQVLTIREESYVEASRVTGMPTHYILRRDIMPQLMPYVLVNFMNAARGVIAGAVGLYFIGVLPYSNENWGVLLNQEYTIEVVSNPVQASQFFVPLMTIVLFSLGLVLTAQGFDRVFNPRLRAKHAKTTPDEGDDDSEGGI